MTQDKELQDKEMTLEEKILASSQHPGHFSSRIGLKFDRIDRYGGEGSFEATWDLCNPYGIVHGGVYYTMMDQMAGMAACCTGRGAVTLDGNMSYLKAAKVGDRVRCVLKSIHQGGKVCLYRGECLGEDGTLFATGEFHLYLTGRLEDKVQLPMDLTKG